VGGFFPDRICISGGWSRSCLVLFSQAVDACIGHALAAQIPGKQVSWWQVSDGSAAISISRESLQGGSNVLAGRCNGKEVLIFDAVVGTGKGVYATFFAVRSEDDPFGGMPEPWTLVHSNGWFALWRVRFWQIPWTMSVRLIEEQLRKL
jgi:hypothetical protein